MRKLLLFPLATIMSMALASAVINTGESVLIFGGVASLLFTAWFLIQLSTFINIQQVKTGLVVLSGLTLIVNLGFVTGSLQQHLTSASLPGAFGAFFVAFTILMTGSSFVLAIILVLMIKNAYQSKRGLIP